MPESQEAHASAAEQNLKETPQPPCGLDHVSVHGVCPCPCGTPELGGDGSILLGPCRDSVFEACHDLFDYGGL